MAADFKLKKSNFACLFFVCLYILYIGKEMKCDLIHAYIFLYVDMDEGEMEHIEQMMDSEELVNESGNQSTACVSENQSTDCKTSTNDAVDKEKPDKFPVEDVDTDSIKGDINDVLL